MFQSPRTSYALDAEKMGSPDFNHHPTMVFQGRPLPCSNGVTRGTSSGHAPHSSSMTEAAPMPLPRHIEVTPSLRKSLGKLGHE